MRFQVKVANKWARAAEARMHGPAATPASKPPRGSRRNSDHPENDLSGKSKGIAGEPTTTSKPKLEPE